MIAWRTSSYSYGGGNCAEVGQGAAGVSGRDSKDRGGVVLTVPAAAWTAFTRRMKDGAR